MQMTIRYYDVDLRCEFDIEKYTPATYDSPEEGGYIYDLVIYIEDTDVTNIFTENQTDSIEQIIWEQL